MQKTEKEQVVAALAERLRETDALIVADYRGLTNSQLGDLRARLREHGAKLQVVKNTLTRRAAEAAGAEQLLALLEGPTAIAFVESDGDPIAVAKALADVAKETKVLSLRGGVLSGRTLTDADIEELAKLPPADVVKSQLVGVIIAPLTQLLGLLEAPVRDLVGLIDARIAQLEEGGAAPAQEGGTEPAAEAGADESAPAEEPVAEAAGEEPVAEAPAEEPDSETEAGEAAESQAEGSAEQDETE
jgi:large subunit ribosomal protein L10